MRERLLCAAALVLAACSGEIAGPGAGDDDDGGSIADAGVGTPDAAAPLWVDGGTLAERVCPPDSVVTYQSFAAGFIAEYCTGCHSSEIPANMRQDAPPEVNFNTYEEIQQRADRVYARAADGYRTMPPAGGPTPEERVLLGEWLACGLP
jgi:hypothetical protein